MSKFWLDFLVLIFLMFDSLQEFYPSWSWTECWSFGTSCWFCHRCCWRCRCTWNCAAAKAIRWDDSHSYLCRSTWSLRAHCCPHSVDQDWLECSPCTEADRGLSILEEKEALRSSFCHKYFILQKIVTF